MATARSHIDRGQLFGTDGRGTYWQEQELGDVRSPEREKDDEAQDTLHQE